MRVVVDTSVFIAALIGGKGPSRELLRMCLAGQLQALMGNALVAEYEAVASRPTIRQQCVLTPSEIGELLDAFCSVCEWIPVYYLLRPNLPDEGDNHLVELAAAGNAEVIATNNARDFRRAELAIPGIRILAPQYLLKEIRDGNADN